MDSTANSVVNFSLSYMSFLSTACDLLRYLLSTKESKMDQYSYLLSSPEYSTFIRDNAEYADVCGYNVSTKRGMTEAMADQFLFQEFLDEQNAVA